VAFGAANTAKGVPQRAKEATAAKKGFARRREKRKIRISREKTHPLF
jgi:hypothetical protein